MGKKGKKEANKEVQRAEREKQAQVDLLLTQAKDFIKQKCTESLQAQNSDELRYWNQRLNNPHLVHIQAIECAGQQENQSESENNLKTLYADFVRRYTPEALNIMHSTVLSKIDANFSSSQISTILNSLEINLRNVQPITVLSSQEGKTVRVITSILLDAVYKKWNEDKEEAQTILKLFISKNLPLQVNSLSDNAMLRCVSQYPEDIQFIKMLLDSGHFDVNTVILPEKPNKLEGKIIHARTAFSLAFSWRNTELMELLLEYGADPYLAAKASIVMQPQKGPQVAFSAEEAQKVMVAHQIGFEKLSPEQQNQFYLETTLLIKNFFLRKAEELVKIAIKKEETRLAKALEKQARAEDIAKKKAEKAASSKATQKAADEELTPKGGAAAEEELAPKGAPADAEAPLPRAAEVRSSETEFLDRFIDSQEQAARNTELPEEIREGSKFDALVLRYIQTRENAALDEITALLSGPHSSNNSSYYIKVLIELDTSMEDAGEILATTPRLLHRFCTVHKEIQSSSSIAADPEEPNFGVDVYPVAGTKIFLQIDPELITSLPEDQLTKIQSQLSSPRFIAQNSLGISGVKDYGHNISKLKIAGPDSNLVSTLRYKDEDGNLLIVFNQFLSHKETEALKQGECVQVRHIQEVIFSVSTEDELPPLEGSQTPTYELPSGAPHDEHKEVELGGDGLE